MGRRLGHAEVPHLLVRKGLADVVDGAAGDPQGVQVLHQFSGCEGAGGGVDGGVQVRLAARPLRRRAVLGPLEQVLRPKSLAKALPQPLAGCGDVDQAVLGAKGAHGG